MIQSQSLTEIPSVIIPIDTERQKQDNRIYHLVGASLLSFILAGGAIYFESQNAPVAAIAASLTGVVGSLCMPLRAPAENSFTVKVINRTTFGGNFLLHS